MKVYKVYFRSTEPLATGLHDEVAAIAEADNENVAIGKAAQQLGLFLEGFDPPPFPKALMHRVYAVARATAWTTIREADEATL